MHVKKFQHNSELTNFKSSIYILLVVGLLLCVASSRVWSGAEGKGNLQNTSVGSSLLKKSSAFEANATMVGPISFDGILHGVSGSVDASLEALIRASITNHPSVLAQHARIVSAESNIQSAKWQYFPTPNVTLQRAYADANDPSFQGDDNAYTVSLDQPLWTGGRLKAGVASARAELAIASASVGDSEQSISFRVVQAYGDWLSAWLQSQALITSLATHQKLYDQVLRRQEAGVSNGSDLSLARGRLQSTKAQLVVVQAQQESAISVLSQITNIELDSASLSKSRGVRPELIQNIRVLLDEAVARDPSVERSQGEKRRTAAEIRSRKSALRPDVFLRFERDFGDFQFSNSGPDSRVIVGVRSQLGAGLSSLSNVASAEAELKASEAQINANKQDVRERVLQDYSLANSFSARIVALEIAQVTAQDVSDSYARQFLAGRKSWLDVMNAARDLQQAELQLADAQAGFLVVSWRLRIRVQGVPGGIHS